ncbi:MAG: hypothetical protein K0R65_44 [Crocinitomicaceae bacterium]|jgi:glycosyltransferase involved in cell wall biosynthesis|nr:hypothetical protein [Crocinitomicaceae bacterium]
MRILLSGNTFHGYDHDLVEALAASGHEVKAIFNNIHGPFNRLADLGKKIRFGILPDKMKVQYFKNLSVANYNKALKAELKRSKYDLLLVIGAKTLDPEWLQEISIPKALWFMDGVKFYPHLQHKFRFFDSVFLFEPTDIPYVKQELGLDAHVLHLGFNPKRFFPLQTEKDIDYSFIGSFYENRNELLKSVAGNSLNGLIIGDFKRSDSEEIKARNSQQQISIDETNALFNRSKININIHHKQSIEGLNVRSFEIMGSGNAQLIDSQKVARDFFTDGVHCLFYSSVEEFQEKLLFYVKNDSALETIRKNAYEIALQNHTWKHRTDELIATIKEIGLI